MNPRATKARHAAEVAGLSARDHIAILRMRGEDSLAGWRCDMAYLFAREAARLGREYQVLRDADLAREVA